MSVQEVINKFIAAINSHDVKMISELMTDDHKFIDSGGQIYSGCAEMEQGWISYFKMVPDYFILISETFVSGNTIVMLGKATGTYTSVGTLKKENYWETPAAWKAIVSNDKVKEWQVFADNEPIHEIMRHELKSDGA